MSSGHYCVIRDLGLVKGGKGLRHHEVVLDLTLRGALRFAKSVFAARPDWSPESAQDSGHEPVLAAQATHSPRP